jgi:ABC-type iron transport system FetAB ATPase subunit
VEVGAGPRLGLCLLAALDEPAAGTVEIDGVPTSQANPAQRRHTSYATQRPGLLSTTVIRNVELPLRWRGLERSACRSAALAALERLTVIAG